MRIFVNFTIIFEKKMEIFGNFSIIFDKKNENFCQLFNNFVKNTIFLTKIQIFDIQFIQKLHIDKR